MATIQKRVSKSGDVSFLIRVSLGYDNQNKQVIKSMTYKPNKGLTEEQAVKEANRQAEQFELLCKSEVGYNYHKVKMRLLKKVQEWSEMNKKCLARCVFEILNSECELQKRSQQQSLKIVDELGNCEIIKIPAKNIDYRCDDIEKIIDTMFIVIEDAIKHGEEVSLYGFGTLGLHHRAARKTKKVGTDEWVDVEARYVPKFSAGKSLKQAARIYEQSVSTNQNFTENEHHKSTSSSNEVRFEDFFRELTGEELTEGIK